MYAGTEHGSVQDASGSVAAQPAGYRHVVHFISSRPRIRVDMAGNPGVLRNTEV